MARKSSTEKTPNLGGRPTDYKPKFAEQARKLCLLGYTDLQLAEFFEVSEKTINNWKKKYPKFLQSIKSGKTIADADCAANLYNGTHDRVIEEQHAFKIKKTHFDDRGKKVDEESVEIVEIKRTIPADFRSQQFWLKNRQPALWRDAQEHKIEGQVETVPISKAKIIAINKALEDEY